MSWTQKRKSGENVGNHRKPKVVIAAAGTGGHVMPAFSLAQHLKATEDADILWLGRRDLSEKKAHQANIAHIALHVSGFKRVGLWRRVVALWQAFYALLHSIWILLRFKPDAVVGFGGFVTVPVGLAAVLTRTPLFIHEQNTVPGLANRVLARWAQRIWLTFPESFLRWSHKCEWVGVPHQVQAPALKDTVLHEPTRILILGGSLGAMPFNQALPKLLSKFHAQHALHIVHQTGMRHLESVKKEYESCKFTPQVVAFIEDMQGAYAWADIVVSRAGALSLSEITHAGCPSIVIPYPQAADNHQEANARFYRDKGAVLMLKQPEIKDRFIPLLQKLILDDEQRAKMKQAMQQLKRNEPLEAMAQTIREAL